ncbi:hypothetical protein LWI29_000439 [Acer saccharum]|uniref:CCHC-type domain-containing protein n=1 Tax=Acer saccharum TaxID=4024 RepID=A0AA39RQH1_ACESA|nr:hypothetical protein LWI29_000439 [Acer saccharum]
MLGRISTSGMKLNAWNAQKRNHQRLNIKTSRRALKEANARNVTYNWVAIRIIENKLDDALATEEQYWRQRANADWMMKDNPSAKEIWNALEYKYNAKEKGTNKFLIAKYFYLKMFDEKPILHQVHELQVIVNKLRAVKIELPKQFQVGSIIAKFPSSWKSYMNRIINKSEDFNLEQIQKHLRIEEKSRSRDKNEDSYTAISKANVVNKPNNHNKSNLNKENSQGPKNAQKKFQKNKKAKGACFVCGKPGHYAHECRF